MQIITNNKLQNNSMNFSTLQNNNTDYLTLIKNYSSKYIKINEFNDRIKISKVLIKILEILEIFISFLKSF